MYMGMFANIHYDWFGKLDQVKYKSDEQMVKNIQILSAFFEICFLIEMVLQFFKRVTPDGHAQELTGFLEISVQYLKTDFIWHLIPLLPLQYIRIEKDDGSFNKLTNYLLIPKILRLQYVADLYDINAVMKYLKQLRHNSLRKLIEEDKGMAQDIS